MIDSLDNIISAKEKKYDKKMKASSKWTSCNELTIYTTKVKKNVSGNNAAILLIVQDRLNELHEIVYID